MTDFKNSAQGGSAFGGKNIAVIGGGVEGLSSEKYLKSKGAKVTVLDKNPSFAKASEGKSGDDYLSNLNSYDLIVRSPGVNPSLLKDVSQNKITSQTNLFLELNPGKTIGVTGTKGKGTTSSLIYEMLKKQGFDAYIGGNIGKPPFDFLDNLNVHSVVVLEMSSFQLLDIKKSPSIAVILMTTSEHLDWHENQQEYINAKRNILRFQTEKDFSIINKDYLPSRESDVETSGKIYYVSAEDESERGCFVRQNSVWLRDPLVNSGQVASEERIINTNEILLPGKHNLENVTAASMAAYIAGVSINNISYVLKRFKGLEHRLELFETINGVKYYDDSIATNPESTIAAINAFTNPEILILGGASKNSDFSTLGSVINKSTNIKAIIGVGQEWPKIKSQISNLKSQIYIIEGAENMQQVVAAASKIAAPGDVVLLSPACTSFDMFKDYKDRGDQFKKEVLQLKTS